MRFSTLFPTLSTFLRQRHGVASVLLFLGVYWLSFLGWLYPSIVAPCLAVVTLVVVVATTRSLALGLLIVIGEVFIGSFGRLMSIDVGITSLSVRMILFLSFGLGAFLWGIRRKGEWKELLGEARNFVIQFPWLAVFAGGSLIGLIRAAQLHNESARVIDDANQWIFLSVLFILPWALQKQWFSSSLSTLYRVSMIALSILTLAILYIFTHDTELNIAIAVFRWARDTRLAEITLLSSSFSRVFLQSQILLLPLWFALVHQWVQRRIGRASVPYLLILVSSVLIVSLSRSFWVGMIAGGGLLLVLHLRESGMRIVWPFVRSLIVAGGGAVMLIWVTIHLPFPPSISVSLGDTLLERTTTLSEAAVGSRWSLLPALWGKVQRHPVMGSGFGSTVTYTSQDPRILEAHPTGEYTTHAFEWGILDFWYKFGVVGLAMIAALLAWAYQLLRSGMPISSLSVVSLIAVHSFTPYLNHPLGFIYLLLIMVASARSQDLPAWIFDTQKTQRV